jgi:hypothetical protein
VWWERSFKLVIQFVTEQQEYTDKDMSDLTKSPSTPKLTAMNNSSVAKQPFFAREGLQSALLKPTTSASRFPNLGRPPTSNQNQFFEGQMQSHHPSRQIGLQGNTYSGQMQTAIHHRPTSPRITENRYNKNISNQYNFPSHMATNHHNNLNINAFESSSTTTRSSPYASSVSPVTDQETQELAMESSEGSVEENGLSTILRSYQEEHQRIMDTCLPKIQETFQKLLEMKRSFTLKLEETANHTQTIKKRKRETLQGIEELR